MLRTSISQPMQPAPNAGSRTVGVCVPDPEGLESLCEALAHVEGGDVQVVNDVASALDAAFQGTVDALVVLPSQMTAEALTALSFLQQARPDVTLYAIEETPGGRGYRLCSLANFLIPGGGAHEL